MTKLRTTNCYKSARYHKIRFFKMLKDLAESGNPEAMYYMIQLGETKFEEEDN